MSLEGASPVTFKDAGGDPIEVGYCAKHLDLAKRYSDGSWACWWECTVEASGDHQDRDFIPLEALLKDHG